MSKHLEDQTAKVIAELIDAFALKAIVLIEDCGSQSIEAVGRTKMPSGEHVAWQIRLGLEEDASDGETTGEYGEEPDDEIALVSHVPKVMSKKLN